MEASTICSASLRADLAFWMPSTASVTMVGNCSLGYGMEVKSGSTTRQCSAVFILLGVCIRVESALYANSQSSDL